MKTFFKLAFAGALILPLVVGIALWQQNGQIKRGELVILYPTSGCFTGGPVYVVKKDRRIINKSSVFPVTLWESHDGKVYSRHDMIAIRAYIVANIPASAEEESLFRQYFPI